MEEAAQRLYAAQAAFDKSIQTANLRFNNLSSVWRDRLHTRAADDFDRLLRPNLNQIPETMGGFADLILTEMRVFEEMDQRVKDKIWMEMDMASAALIAAMPILKQLETAGILVTPNLSSEYYYGPMNKCRYREYYNSGRMNCTYYCYGRLLEKTEGKMELTGCVGNANMWLKQAKQNGHETGTDIRSNSVAVITTGGGGYGHVVFIEEVIFDDEGRPATIVFSEGNGGARSADGEIMEWSYSDFIRKVGRPEGYIYPGQ
jgi:surface antigen